MPWPIADHESPDVDLSIARATAPYYLWAMLSAEGKEFRPPYDEVRPHIRQAIEYFRGRQVGGQAPTAELSDQRLRTWRSTFERMGLLTIDANQSIQPTTFGRAVLDGVQTVQGAIDRSNSHIAELGALVANRVLLAHPNAQGVLPPGVPPDADLRPLRLIWRAFRRLGNRLHWQDVNRVLGHVHYESEVESALNRIQAFRSKHPGAYPTAAPMIDDLGSPLTDDPRHITPWFNRAGIGGMLIPSEPDPLGFRTLHSASLLPIDGLLAEAPPPIPASASSDRQAYLAYLMAPVEEAKRPPIESSDRSQVDSVLQAVRQFGKRRLIVLSGLPGTGKTRLARIVAGQLTDGDPLRLKVVQFHKGFTYDDFVEGFVPKPDGQGFERRMKTLRVINQRALENPGKPHVLLIEELTRADVIAVLGELLTYIEHRGDRFTFSLSQDESTISPDLIVLCTMNPRDKSAVSLDDALARRMHRISVPPSAEGLRGMLAGRLPPTLLDLLETWYREHLHGLPFGHGIFDDASDWLSLRQIWEGTAVPLLSDPLGRVLETHSRAHASFPFASDQPPDATASLDAEVEPTASIIAGA